MNYMDNNYDEERLERERRRIYRRKIHELNRLLNIIGIMLIIAVITFVASIAILVNDNKRSTKLYDAMDTIQKQLDEIAKPQPINITVINDIEKVVVNYDDYVEIVETNNYFDVPLSEEVQDYIYEVTTEFDNVPPELVFAVIEKESQFDPDARSKTGDSGLMQVNDCNLTTLKDDYGINDIYDPKQNILGGVSILSYSIEKADGDFHKALMCYNMGYRGAKELWNEGIYTSSYSREVMEYYNNYIK